VLVWLSVWSEVQTCIWPSWCHCYSLSLASVKSRLVLPFWYRVVPEKGPLNGCVCCSHCNSSKIYLVTVLTLYALAKMYMVTLLLLLLLQTTCCSNSNDSPRRCHHTDHSSIFASWCSFPSYTWLFGPTQVCPKWHLCRSVCVIRPTINVYLTLWTILSRDYPSMLWRCWLGVRKGIRPVKNWVVGCGHGYLSGASCRLAYVPADSTATHCLLLQ